MGGDGSIEVGGVSLKWVRTQEMDGVACPWYVGYAYRTFDTGSITYWIVPINLIIGGWLWLWFHIRWGFHNSLESKITAAKRAERSFVVVHIMNELLVKDCPVSAQYVSEWYHKHG